MMPKKSCKSSRCTQNQFCAALWKISFLIYSADFPGTRWKEKLHFKTVAQCIDCGNFTIDYNAESFRPLQRKSFNFDR